VGRKQVKTSFNKSDGQVQMDKRKNCMAAGDFDHKEEKKNGGGGGPAEWILRSRRDVGVKRAN